MSAKGSVLVVVLGLLAILAIVGITFITMSSIDRSTSSNFALQTQFDLGADAALDYVADILGKDQWSWEKKTDASGNSTYLNRLLSDPSLTGGPKVAANNIDNSTEPYDWPGITDPWLSSPLDPNTSYTTANAWWSFKGATVTCYGLNFLGTTLPTGPDFVDNVGYGTCTGVWNPDLVFPYEGGLIRISLTILDHGGMINLNAHGNGGTSLAGSAWLQNNPGGGMQDAVGNGYFISDVGFSSDTNPSAARLLLGQSPGTTAFPMGRWGQASRPVGANGEVFPENPSLTVTTSQGAQTNTPFTLDEEFQLRSLSNSGYQSRLRVLAPSIFTDVKHQLAYTTVGWTSLVLPDGLQTGHIQAATNNNKSITGQFSAYLPDLNTDDVGTIYNAMYWTLGCPACTLSNTNWVTQFMANIAGYRDSSTGCGIKQITLNPSSGGGTTNAVAASRQPILSKVLISAISTDTTKNPPVTTWTVQVQAMSPWTNDSATQPLTAGITTTGMAIQAATNGLAGATVTINTGNLPGIMTSNGTPPATPFVGQMTVTAPDPNQNLQLGQVLRNITLMKTDVWGGIKLDEIAPQDLGTIRSQGAGCYRPIFWAKEPRGAQDPSPVLAVYVGKWQNGTGPGNISQYTSPASQGLTSGIAIRFPRSAESQPPNLGLSSNLPVRATAAQKPFKAFARIGDLDRVLCRHNKHEGNFWGTPPGQSVAVPPLPQGDPPWIVCIANANAAAEPTGVNTGTTIAAWPGSTDFERRYKFDWQAKIDHDSATSGATNLPPVRMNIANAVCVGGPWHDTLSNAGTNLAYIDYLDRGTIENNVDYGRYGGPEFRVMGLVNLNTASPLLLTTMETSLYITGLSSTSNGVPALRATAAITSPAMLLPNNNTNKFGVTATNYSSTAPQGIEKDDEGFCRISSLATVRSDTFSVYGTVQYITLVRPASGTTVTANVVRSRRFWALLDRSVTAAYIPPPVAGPGVPQPLVPPSAGGEFPVA